MNKKNYRGILMSGVMVRAWLAGLKWQTRRTRGLDEINQSPNEWKFEGIVTNDKFVKKAMFSHFVDGVQETKFIRLPYGYIGDGLYFKETWKMWEEPVYGKDFLHFRADDAKVDPTWWTEDDWRAPNPKWCPNHVFSKWQSSMLMPKMCARIHTTVRGVRVERLKQIGTVDAIGEGMGIFALGQWTGGEREAYFKLWDQLNVDKLPAERDPWVWVYEFEKNPDPLALTGFRMDEKREWHYGYQD